MPKPKIIYAIMEASINDSNSDCYEFENGAYLLACFSSEQAAKKEALILTEKFWKRHNICEFGYESDERFNDLGQDVEVFLNVFDISTYKFKEKLMAKVAMKCAVLKPIYIEEKELR